VVDYRLNLFSDFTYFLDDPVNGDQFEQSDRRAVSGGSVNRTWLRDWRGRTVEHTVAVQARNDIIPSMARRSWHHDHGRSENADTGRAGRSAGAHQGRRGRPAHGHLAGAWREALDVCNLFNREVSDIDYYYTSHLPGEPAEGFDDIHTHPAEPRSARLSLAYNF
jgi:hypothetical protein